MNKYRYTFNRTNMHCAARFIFLQLKPEIEHTVPQVTELKGCIWTAWEL